VTGHELLEFLHGRPCSELDLHVTLVHVFDVSAEGVSVATELGDDGPSLVVRGASPPLRERRAGNALIDWSRDV